MPPWHSSRAATSRSRSTIACRSTRPTTTSSRSTRSTISSVAIPTTSSAFRRTSRRRGTRRCSYPTPRARGHGSATFDIDWEDMPVSAYCSQPHQIDAWFKAYAKAREMCGGPAEYRRPMPVQEVEYLNALLRGVYAKRDLPAGHRVTPGELQRRLLPSHTIASRPAVLPRTSGRRGAAIRREIRRRADARDRRRCRRRR